MPKGSLKFTLVLLKMCKYELVEPLEIIYKESLETGIIPNGWKKALIFPIHKGGSRSVPANYRPVSLTSHLMKTFERVIKRYLVANLEAHKKFNDSQHGFRQGMSCLTQLVQNYHNLLEKLEDGSSLPGLLQSL